jgi:Glycosyltransferase family 25 (LPS biosynthesis protein)
LPEDSLGYVKSGQNIVNSMINIDHIYIIHYHQESNRRVYLEKVLPNFNIPYTFRSLYDRNSPELFDEKYFLNSENNKNIKNAVMSCYGKILEKGMDSSSLKGRAYRAATLEHYKTYEHIVYNTNYEHVLILEDDVRFKDNFLTALKEYEKNIPEDYDICYIGSGCGLNLPYPTTKLIDIHPQKYSRCSDSYIIKRPALQKIVATALPFYGAIDWDLNYIQMVNNFNVYWVTNPLIYQGSQHGQYESSFHIFE